LNNIVFVTATGTNVGKTYVTTQLIKTLSKKGYKVAAFKPIETGVNKAPQDAKKLLKAVQKHSKIYLDYSPNDITSYTYKLPAAPYVAKAKSQIDFVKIIEDIQRFSKECDILFVEGAGGLMVPIDEQIFIYDLIKFLDATPLLVVSSKLGGINECLLSLEKLGSDALWTINLYEDKESFNEVSKPFYDIYFKKYYRFDKDIKKLAKKVVQKLGIDSP
jgi:dethiobiotin synthetase